jgi:Putative thioesterase (yiiD_Cterm)
MRSGYCVRRPTSSSSAEHHPTIIHNWGSSNNSNKKETKRLTGDSLNDNNNSNTNSNSNNYDYDKDESQKMPSKNDAIHSSVTQDYDDDDNDNDDGKRADSESRITSAVARDMERHLHTTQKPARALGIRIDEYCCSTRHDKNYDTTTTTTTTATLSLSAPLDLNHNVHGTAFAGSLYSVGVLCSFYLARQWLLQETSSSALSSLSTSSATNVPASSSSSPPPSSSSSSSSRSDTSSSDNNTNNNNNALEVLLLPFDKYQLVARAGTIRYRKPVTSIRFVAQSKLPTPHVLEQFRTDLATKGKAIMDVKGYIFQHSPPPPLLPPKLAEPEPTHRRNITVENVVAVEYSIEICAYLLSPPPPSSSSLS